MDCDENASKTAPADLDITRNGALAIITLNRPRAYNAINYDMRAAFAESLPDIARDPENYALVIRSSSQKAFSAGADVRESVTIARDDIAAAREGFKAEYTLNWLLECFTKPTVSLMNGMVIGSGVGITAYNTHRVAAEGYSFSMPETAIGLFPDVGIASVLSRLPDDIGMYLGLTGARLGRADAYALGLTTHCISAKHFASIEEQLADAQPVDQVLDRLHEDPGPGDLLPHRPTIARCFSAKSVEDIIARLKQTSGAEVTWANGVITEIGKKSPLSLKVTLQHIRAAREMDLREILAVDYRLACRFLDDPDYYEGVRAALIDKDGNPRWQPATLAAVTPAMVDAYFKPMDVGELNLPPRDVAQQIRR